MLYRVLACLPVHHAVWGTHPEAHQSFEVLSLENFHHVNRLKTPHFATIDQHRTDGVLEEVTLDVQWEFEGSCFRMQGKKGLVTVLRSFCNCFPECVVVVKINAQIGEFKSDLEFTVIQSQLWQVPDLAP